MSGTTIIAIGRNTKVFAKKETVPGTLVIPAAGDLVMVNTGELQVPMPNMAEDGAARSARGVSNRYNTHTPGAPFKLQRYVRPSGSAGSVPEAAPLYESAFGTQEISGGVHVLYSPAATQPSFSLYVLKDHVCYVAAGCVIDKLGVKKNNKDILEASDDGKAFSVIWTGTGALGEAIVTAPAPGTEEWFLVDDVKKWCVGSHIVIDTEQMQITGTWWEGTAGGSAGKIKMKRGHNGSAVATHLISAAITPWLPTGTETGLPLAARVGTLTLDAVSVPFLDIDFNLSNNITQNEDEVTGSATPTDYFEGNRVVDGSLNIYFRKTDAKWFADAVKQVRKAAIINFGSVAGKLAQISMPYCEFDMPTYDAGKELMKLSIKYKAFDSAGNDEATLKFL